ncbi:unnamed protein product [Sphagnum jensenii]|uniref:Uncharacterized protein n=1 Tax=Sphagnum jensenii TaxID=128206 RepID=A0ABP1BGN4_9BRYO
MGPKTYATTYASLGEKKLSWLDRMCLKLETYYDIVEPGLAPSVLIQKMEVRFNTLGAGVRKFANEANDFVQELLILPTPNGGDNHVEKVMTLEKQLSVEVVCDEREMLHESHDEMKAVSDSSLLSDIANSELLTMQAEEVPFGEVSWNWTLNPLEDSELQLSHDLGNATICSSMVLTDIPLRGFESEDHVLVDNVEVESSIEKQEKDENPRAVGGCEAAAPDSDPSASSSLDGWEGGDIIFDEDDMEPDSWQDWELI